MIWVLMLCMLVEPSAGSRVQSHTRVHTHQNLSDANSSSLGSGGAVRDYVAGSAERNLCDKWLMVEYSPIPWDHHPRRFYVEEWKDLELFTKMDAKGCEKTYVIDCQVGALRVTRSRGRGHSCDQKNSKMDKKTKFEEETLCLGSKSMVDVNGWVHFFDCPNSRTSPISTGESITLYHVPGEEVTELSTGYVKVQVGDPESERAKQPRSEDMEAVITWALRLAGHDLAQQSLAHGIRTRPDDALESLQKLAQHARVNSDGVDIKLQAMNHILELHFTMLNKFSIFNLGHGSPRERISNLAADYAEFKELEAMSASQLAVFKSSSPWKEGRIKHMKEFFQGIKTEVDESASSHPKALIFTCSFGGGHKSAAQAVQGFLQAGGFAVQVIDTTYDPQFHDATIVAGASMFNDLIIKHQMYSIHNAWDSVVGVWQGQLNKPCPAPKCNNERKDQFRKAILQNRPDLLVTVYHMEVLPVLELAKDLGNLPLLHIATDMDIKMDEVFGRGPGPVYPRFQVGVPFSIPESYATVPPLIEQQTFLSGYPVRPAFLVPSDDAQVQEEKAKLVPSGTKVLLVMTGGGGQDVPWPYRLADQGIGEKMHIVIIAGGNNELAKNLRKALPNNVRFPDGRRVWQGNDTAVTVEVAVDADVPKKVRKTKPYYVFEKRLAMLMDMADCVLTKPGGGTTAEIAYRGVPSVFDATNGLFHWEEFTVRVFEGNGSATSTPRGLRFEKASQLRGVLRRAMSMGRSTVLAEDPETPGTVIQTGTKILRQAQKLLTTECDQCKVFAK